MPDQEGPAPADAPDATTAKQDANAGGGPEDDATATADADPRDEELADLRQRLLRARADYENLQRRVERERDLERERVRARVLEDFLQVYEYGRMAQVEAQRHPGPLAEGVQMVVREFDRLLEGQGVRRVGAAGDRFDPAHHEAVAEEEGPAGSIVRVVSPGYLLGERVLRYARVVVGSSTAQKTPSGLEEE